MTGRRTDEPDRRATWLELLFDLCFVLAVSEAAGGLHDDVASGATAVVSGIHYLMVFFAIWWAWVNFTWFASAFDNDDVLYRLATMVQIAGGLVLAAGIPRAFANRDFAVVTVGYVIMRVGLVSQWLRVASTRRWRRTGLRFAAGVTACQVGWLSLLLLPAGWQPWGWLLLVPGELSVPVWGERPRRTAWHPHHVAERYGLFTIIVLGETVLSTTVAIRSAVDTRHGGARLAAVTVGALLVLLSLWWLYFSKPVADLLGSNRVAFVWSYGHYLVFSSVAAVGAGLTVAVDRATGHPHLPAWAAGLVLTGPVAVFLVVVWFLHVRPRPLGVARLSLYPVTAVAVLAVSPVGQVALATGLLLAGLVTVLTALSVREGRAG